MKPRLTSVVAAAAALAALLAVPVRATAQTARYAVVIEGASGGDEYSGLHRRWLDAMTKILREKFGYDAAHLTVLAETPKAGEARATSEVVKATFTAYASQLKPTDTLFVLLIGHGGGDGAEAKFNLVGPDLTVTEWNGLLKPIAARMAFVDATSASFPFLAGLAAPQRVVITATSSPAQRYHTMFPDAFIQAFTTPSADLNKDGRISMWEAFTYASRQTAQYYEQKGQLATEHSILDDTGDGVGRLSAATTGDDGLLAGMMFLDALPETKSSDPEVQALIVKRDALTVQVDDLRLHRRMISAADFEQAFEKLIVELATVSREIRRKTGG